jgi:DNA-binding IclR family transcriptional regulator
MKSQTRERAEREGEQMYAAPALEKGLDIIELLSTAPEGLTIKDMSQRLGRSISEIFRVIMVMERRRWLRKDPESDRYGVTYHALDAVQRATPAQTLAEVAKPAMLDFATKTNQSCHLVVRSGGIGMVLHRQESSAPAGFSIKVGAIIDLVTSCSGHVLLGYLDSEERDAAIQLLSKPTKIPEKRLRQRLDTVREQGFERQPSARTSGVTDVSFPVFGFNGAIMAALTMPYLEMLDDYHTVGLDVAQAYLGEAARKISADLGWVG